MNTIDIEGLHWTDVLQAGDWILIEHEAQTNRLPWDGLSGWHLLLDIDEREDGSVYIETYWDKWTADDSMRCWARKDRIGTMLARLDGVYLRRKVVELIRDGEHYYLINDNYRAYK